MAAIDCSRATNLLLVTNFTQSSSYYLATKQIQSYNHQVRADTIKHYYFDGKNHTVAVMQNRLTTDLKNTNDNYLINFFRSVQMVCYILFAVIVLLLIHLSLLLVTLILVGISIYLPQLIAKPIQSAFSNISDSNKKYLDVAEKWLNGLNTLQRYMAGGHLFKVMDEAAQKVQASKVQQTKINQELAVMNGLVSNLLMLALFAFTAVLIANKLVIFGTITTVGNLQFYMSTGFDKEPNKRGISVFFFIHFKHKKAPPSCSAISILWVARGSNPGPTD
ncbi:ABC transporter transmembrane domain-containing protein [Lactobacillus helveticus]|uniref:ABC transporter transmembrane domain-containing protein n=4 Tax=Lactobacillus helveticus TaxID=1587 RepID=UPI003460EBD4